MKKENLLLPEQVSGYTHKITVKAEDLAAAVDNALTLDLLTLSVGQVIGRTAFRLVTAFDFSDTAILSLAAKLGDAGSSNRFIDTTELAEDGTEVFAAVSGTAYAYNAAGVLKLALTGTATKLINTATKGELVILVQLVDLTKI